MGSDCYWDWVSLGGDKTFWNQTVVIVTHPVNTPKTIQLYILNW